MKQPTNKNYPHWLCSLMVAAAAILAGCASPTYYQASGTDSRVWGYSDQQVDGALFRVTYMDSYQAGTERTYAYAMYRAAELARDKGATHFEVLEGLLNREMLERFMARPATVGASGSGTADDAMGSYDARDAQVLDIANQRLEAASAPLPTLRVRTYIGPTYIYVPVQPPPPPQQVSMLIRLLNAPSLDAARGFEVRTLLTRLGPLVLRAPLKPV
jgi:hypothetical protein